MINNVRVRFAPSPTGPLHIGGVRTALFNYLFAKKHNGKFILRIEDTDQNRFVNGAEKYIVDSLKWCGIHIDEGPSKNETFGPYKQSERKHLYKTYALELITSGHAYYAFDTNETLNNERKINEAEGKTFIYNWRNRANLTNSLSLDATETKKKLDSGEPYVIRFKSPENETLHLTDIIRGDITIQTSHLDDKIIFKSDGMPTYHLANIVDDHLMNISHVIRGEEWLPSLPLHYQLYKALGWNAPEFAHLPLILKPVGKGKLSKRDGDKLGFPVFPLQWTDPNTKETSMSYKEQGYFPEAMINFLALLGWNPGTEQELFTMTELIETFDLKKVQKSGARFDPEKSKWFNHHYMQKQNNVELATMFKTFHKEVNEKSTEYVTTVVALTKERATFTSELWNLSHFFFIAPTSYNKKASKKALKENTKTILQELTEILLPIETFSANHIKQQTQAWVTKSEISFSNVMMPLRLALVGDLKGPDVFDIIHMIGKKETIKRLENLISSLVM